MNNTEFGPPRPEPTSSLDQIAEVKTKKTGSIANRTRARAARDAFVDAELDLLNRRITKIEKSTDCNTKVLGDYRMELTKKMQRVHIDTLDVTHKFDKLVFLLFLFQAIGFYFCLIRK